MKQRKLLALVLGLFILTGIFPFAASADDYLGEFCLAMEEYPEGWRFKMGVSHMGDGHYVLSGVEYQPGGALAPVHGGAQLIDDSFVISVTVAYNGTDESRSFIESKVGQIILDLKTFEGPLSMVHTIQYTDGNERIGDIYHNLIPISCLCPLNEPCIKGSAVS
jgi:hypothetical protein